MGAPSYTDAINAVREVIDEAQKHPRGLVRNVDVLDRKSAVIDAYLCAAPLQELSDRLLVFAAEGLWTCRALSARLTRFKNRLSVMQQIVGACPVLPELGNDGDKKRKRPSKAEVAPAVRSCVLFPRTDTL